MTVMLPNLDDLIAVSLALESELKSVFSVRDHDFSNISVIGCCAEHEECFRWYREHDWQQLSQAAREKLIDPCEFSSLTAKAYHYFVPGVCQLSLQTLRGFLDGSRLVCWSDLKPWIGHLLPSGRRDSTPHSGIELFTTNQKSAVLATIEFYIQCHEVLEGHPPIDGKFNPLPTARAWWSNRAT